MPYFYIGLAFYLSIIILHGLLRVRIDQQTDLIQHLTGCLTRAHQLECRHNVFTLQGTCAVSNLEIMKTPLAPEETLRRTMYQAVRKIQVPLHLFQIEKHDQYLNDLTVYTATLRIVQPPIAD